MKNTHGISVEIALNQYIILEGGVKLLMVTDEHNNDVQREFGLISARLRPLLGGGGLSLTPPAHFHVLMVETESLHSTHYDSITFSYVSC